MSKRKTYTVPVEFVFKGEFQVEAGSAREAWKIVNDECHLVMGQSVQSDSEDVVDWDFDMHSEKYIHRVTRSK